ncbi:alpha/beta hydrolase [Desulfocurvus sp. DL9XJH121]
MDTPLAATAALCIHGFGGEPFEMRGPAEALADLGCAVRAPLLPGHGRTPEAWSRTGFADWAGAVEREYDALRADHERVMVCGLSMGGTLALLLAQARDPACVATLAAPVYLYRFLPPEATDWRLPLVGLIKRVRPLWPGGPANPESRRIAPWKGYEGVTSLPALHSFLRGMARVRRGLPRVSAPLLAVHTTGDATVPASNARFIFDHVSSTVRRLEYLTVRETVTSRHVITTHQETRELVRSLLVEFALAHLP